MMEKIFLLVFWLNGASWEILPVTGYPPTWNVCIKAGETTVWKMENAKPGEKYRFVCVRESDLRPRTGA